MATETTRTLVVEDDRDSREVLCRALTLAGLGCDCVASAGAALVNLEVHPKPSAALIDLGLPDGNGALVLWRIRRDYGKQVPVAVVTGQPDPQFQPHLVREPPDALFEKPLDFGALVTWLKSVV